MDNGYNGVILEVLFQVRSEMLQSKLRLRVLDNTNEFSARSVNKQKNKFEWRNLVSCTQLIVTLTFIIYNSNQLGTVIYL